VTPWHTTEKQRRKEERIEEARALSKFWTKAGKAGKATARHYKELVRELEGE